MAGWVDVALGTVAMRPYVFCFLAAYLVAAGAHLGWRKTAAFTVAGYLIAFTSEFLSINTGFPYGWYYYIDATRSRELWVAGVPFFDSVSYVFLAYCSYSIALLAVSPVRLYGGDFHVLETRAIRSSPEVLILASFLQVFLDIVIDPVALQGRRWFLGQIYGYRENGIHFGVPLSNYLGWFAVSLAMIFVLQLIDGSLSREIPGRRLPAFRFRALLGPLLYLSVVIFNLTVTFLIGEKLMGISGTFLMLLPLVLLGVSLSVRLKRVRDEDVGEACGDYPELFPAARKPENHEARLRPAAADEE